MRLLIVEDEEDMQEALCYGLRKRGYAVDAAGNGTDAVQLCQINEYDLVVLDLNLPGLDGMEVLQQIQFLGKPATVLILSARSELEDKVAGLDGGASDYLTKPFRPTILLMKVKALLRRVEMDRGKGAAADGELRCGDLRYSATENAVFCGAASVALTQTELRLLSYMMKQPEKAYSREELLNAVWGFDSEVETRVTDETLRRIRKKLLQAGSRVSVATIWGFGYRLKEAESV